MKILLITDVYPSGSSQVCGTFVKEFAKASAINNQVTLVHFCDYENLEGKKIGLKEFTEDNIKVFRILIDRSIHHIFKRIIKFYYYNKIIKRLINQDSKPDIINVHVYYNASPAVVINTFYKIPLVITSHSSTLLFPQQMEPIEKFKARYIFNKADFLISVSSMLKDAICKLGIKKDYKIVPNTYDPSIFYPSKVKLEKTDNIKNILFAGLFSSKKNIPDLFGAFSRIKSLRNDFKLTIIGDGRRRKRYEKYSAKLGLSNFIEFVGLKSKKEISEYMRASDFFVLPSKRETFSCVLMEAMACGLPVVASSGCGIIEHINSKFGVVFDPEVEGSLQDAIINMLDNHNNYSKVEIAEYIKDNFSLSVIGQRLDVIFKTIINKQRYSLDNNPMKKIISAIIKALKYKIL